MPKKAARGKRIWAAGSAVILLLLSAVWYLTEEGFLSARSRQLEAGCAEIHFIDVGQGDAALIRTSDAAILIDAGPNSGETALMIYLADLGIRELDWCIFTHPDEDHVGGADAVLTQIPCRNILLPDCSASSPSDERMKTAAERQNVPITYARGGESFTADGVVLTILSAGGEAGDTEAEINECSIVLKAEVGNIRMIFQADAEQPTEQRLLASVPAEAVDCDLLKVAHHGAQSATSDAWLDALSPRFAVISCAHANSYGHPHASALSRLTAHGAEVFRTDESGSIVFFTDGKTIVPHHR